MIASVRGEVLRIDLDSLVLEAAGVGYRLFATPRTLATVRLGEVVLLQTTLVVREDAHTLYAFSTVAERDGFEVLLSVNGVGPRLALAALAVYEAGTIAELVAAEDHKALTKVPGIGEKVARRLVLELQGKLIPTGSVALERGESPESAAQTEVVEALTGLGWAPKVAQAAVERAAAATVAPVAAAQLLRAALQDLSNA